ncbi:MAG: ferritin-like domain-containing protein [Acidobacteriota bacterium]|nr:ferritin-like domain-containing protein [Acidobacteriota bacterium]
MGRVDLGPLGLDRGGHILLERALAPLPVGGHLEVTGRDPALPVHLRAWARRRGHGLVGPPGGGAGGAGSGHGGGEPLVVVRGDADERRWVGARRAGEAGRPASRADPAWGLAARGALVEAGGPPLPGADLDRRDVIWSEQAARLYAQAAANQWDPATVVDWARPDLPDDVEAAVVQTMTYLVENEQAALMVPARFLGRIHPHFREAAAFLATQVADEARHVEVFTRRAGLSGGPPGLSGAGGRASLQSLLDEPDWANASFLLSVLGEGSFLALLSFLERHGPDPVTSRLARVVLADEARHVAFAMGHLSEHVTRRPSDRDRLRAALERRHDALAATAGLAPAVHDSLVVLAAGSWEPSAIASGWDAVAALQAEMDTGRRRRLVHLGFDDRQAAELSLLHTRNFM